jgi:hypothetical protein
VLFNCPTFLILNVVSNLKMKTLQWSIYSSYNILGLIFTLWILLYLNMYINPNFIPSDLRWENGQLREDMTYFMIAQFVILALEIALITLLGFWINRSVLKRMNMNEPKKLAKWTSIGLFLVLTVFSAYSLLKFHSRL